MVGQDSSLLGFLVGGSRDGGTSEDKRQKKASLSTRVISIGTW